MNYQYLKTPVGKIHIVEDKGRIKVAVFDKQWPSFKKKFASLKEQESPILKETRRQLLDYFEGKRKKFNLPIAPEGTDFQKKTWRTLVKIPFGQTRTYKEQALAVGSPNAVRAIGRTNGLNPICVILPCHRVVGSDGSLTGYAGGLEVKKRLLNLEATAA